MTSTLATGEPAASETAPSLSSRLLSPRTIASLVVAAIIVAVAIWRAQINWGATWDEIRHADVRLYLAAVVVFYSSFVVRAFRWHVLLRNADDDRPWQSLTGIIVTSFFVNCVVPAKMGDVYRAYLVRAKQRVSASKALGTIIAERLLDLCVLMVLLLAAGALVFHRRAPGFLIPYAAAGILVCVAGVGVILTMRAGRGRRVVRLLPEAVFHRYESFRVGTVHSFGRYPLLIGLTGTVWGLESARLAFVVNALNYGKLLGPSQFVLVALVAALLTTVPFLPGGLGLVEAGMVGVLIAVGGIGNQAAIAITLLDRSISYASLVVFGFIVFLITHARSPRASPVAAER